MTARCLLLAGSWGPERLPARPAGDDADWFLPLHVRDEAAARERIAAQVAAGADVVVAPTWRTHRRALLPLGETRRAATWTAAAVRVARDAVEVGLERREAQLAEAQLADAPSGDVAPSDVARGRPDPRVAAVLPALDDQPDAGSGRLAPHESASSRDYRDQAGLLADAAPDLLLVEGGPGEAEARLAADEAAATGLPVWLALHDVAVSTSPPEAWIEWSQHVGLARLLLPNPKHAAAAADADLPWGGLLREQVDVATWLDAGATALARLDGASVAAVTPLRAAIDEIERGAIEAEQAAERRWLEHLERAAMMAPGGAALWLGDRPAMPLPDGFEWLVVDPAEAHHLPAGRFRLIVARRPFGRAGDLLDRDGVLALGEPLTRAAGSGLRTVVVDDASVPPLAIYRRER
jgi:hypothetical protein